MKTVLFAGVALAVATMAAGQDRASRSSGSADIDFVLAAAQGGMAEVEIGKLAADHAKSDEVKRFGQRMVDDHSKGGDQLKSLAQAKGIALPGELTPKDKALRQRLERLNGDAFDRAYMRAMVTDHQKDVSEFRHESRDGRDPQVKAWATGILPTLEDHLKMAKMTKGTPAAAGN